MLVKPLCVTYISTADSRTFCLMNVKLRIRPTFNYKMKRGFMFQSARFQFLSIALLYIVLFLSIHG